MTPYTDDEARALVRRLEANGARQSDEVRAAVAKDAAPAARGPQRGAQPVRETLTEEATTALLGTEAGMQTLWHGAFAMFGAGLPEGEAEYLFAAPWRQWRFDYAWPAALVAVELDGMAWQAGGGRHNTDADREKQNSAAALGWRVLRFTSKALRSDSAACVALLRRALER